jgi:cytochrome c oxidase assembly factor CtaG
MTVDKLIATWDIPWLVTSTLIVTALIYLRGWVRIRRTRPQLFPPWRLACFLAGLLAVFVAVASPLDVFDDQLLFIHMMQHFFLMFLAPPLIVFGAPVVPMLRGLPRWILRYPLRPLFSTGIVHRLGGILSRKRVAWLLLNVSYLSWHIPAAYELTLRSENWHNCEHACFLFTGIIFWWQVIAPWPYQPRGSRWAVIPYLLGADAVNTALSAFLCFSNKVLYPSYAAQPRLFGISAMNDQIAAGALMWVMGSMFYLIPGMAVTLQILSPRKQRLAAERVARQRMAPVPH